MQADTVVAGTAAVSSIGGLISSIGTQLGVGVAAIRSVHHSIDFELSLPWPVNPIGHWVIQQQASHLHSRQTLQGAKC